MFGFLFSEEMNILQFISGHLLNILSYISFASNFIQWLHSKRQKRRAEEILRPTNITTNGGQVALVIDLSQNQPNLMIRDVLSSIPKQKEMRVLEKSINTAPALEHEELFMKIRHGFDVKYPKETGRYIILTHDGQMPNDTEASKKYVASFRDTLQELLAALKMNGVKIIHVFYRGPLPLYAYIGTKCTYGFTAYYYHYDSKQNRYFLLSSGHAEHQ